MNNDFLSLVRRFGNDFHSWLRHSWKSLPNRLTRDKKIVIHGNSSIILYILHLNLYFSSEHFSRYRINWNVFKCMKNGCIFIQILLVCFWQEIDLIDNKSAIMKVNHIGLFHDKQFICSTYPSSILLTESNQADLVNLPKLQDCMLTGMFL